MRSAALWCVVAVMIAGMISGAAIGDAFRVMRSTLPRLATLPQPPGLGRDWIVRSVPRNVLAMLAIPSALFGLAFALQILHGNGARDDSWLWTPLIAIPAWLLVTRLVLGLVRVGRVGWEGLINIGLLGSLLLAAISPSLDESLRRAYPVMLAITTIGAATMLVIEWRRWHRWELGQLEPS